MANRKDFGTEEQILAVSVMNESGKGGEPNPLMEKLLELLGRRLAKEDAAERLQEEEMRRLKQAQIATTKEQEEARRYTQDVLCQHVKEDGRPRIGGQKTSDGHTVYICQNCMKTWRDSLPPRLQVGLKLEMIGG